MDSTELSKLDSAAFAQVSVVHVYAHMCVLTGWLLADFIVGDLSLV